MPEKLFGKKEIRQMPVKNYIVFYAVDSEAAEIRVLRIMHSRRDWQNIIP